MSASCRWCGHRSFGVDGHECDGIRLSREHAELRAAIKLVLDSFYVRNDRDNTTLMDAFDDLERIMVSRDGSAPTDNAHSVTLAPGELFSNWPD